MKMILRAFSEELPLDNLTEPQRFLVFDANGETVRIPVEAATIQALVKFYYQNVAKPEAAPSVVPEITSVKFEEQEEEAQEEEQEDPDEDFDEQEEIEEGDPLFANPQMKQPTIPRSEAEVPSL